MMENVIEVKKLRKEFGDLVAVNNVSFNVEKGEVFGFLGPNGAGKSTTINMLCTILRKSGGEGYIAGKEITTDPEGVRKRIGIIFQENSLDSNLTAYENLYMHCQLYGVDKKVRKERINEVLDIVELTDRQKDQVMYFSGGMKRRLEIARGLLHYPQVLFLDEPTIGLDPQTRNKIWDFIKHLKERINLTIFLTTHYMDEAEYCDRIAIIDHGDIIALDTPDVLKDNLGGDVIEISTNDNQRAIEELDTLFGIESKQKDGVISFNVKKGNEFIPGMISKLSPTINSINLHRPTLNDVFLSLTGREIRDEQLTKQDIFKQKMRAGRH